MLQAWNEEIANRVTTVKALSEHCSLSESSKADIDKVTETYHMAISPHLLKLLHNPGIYKQFVPSVEELDNSKFHCDDPLLENVNSPVSRLVHKYPDKVALFVSDICFAYCRHCTRKNTVINNHSNITDAELDSAMRYIADNPQINDVLLTGGDPLTLSDNQLENIIKRVREIKHVSTIRIGTRAIVSAPIRITEDLANTLAKYHPIWINTQFNHPSEITDETIAACDKLQRNGIPLSNQSVLLKGINNNYEVIRELLLKLISIRVRPYYLYQCDYVRGTSHFMTDYREGAEIIEKLQGNIAGYAIPRFIIDIAGNGGKIVAENSNIIRKETNKIVLRGYDGKEYEYSTEN